MMVFFCIFFHFLSFLSGGNDKPEYSIANIDASVLLTESSVIRNKETIVDLGLNGATVTEKETVTLLNNRDFDFYKNILIHYSGKDAISNYNFNIYDKDGKHINEIKKKEIDDYGVRGSSLITDQRVKRVKIPEYAYPFTIEYSYQEKVKDTYLLMSSWALHDYAKSYVEQTRLTINKPIAITYSIKYLLQGVELTKNEVTPQKIYFEAKNIPSVSFEDMAVSARLQRPQILLSPNHFEIDNYSGSFENWASLGDFYGLINEDRYELNESFAEKVRPQVEHANTIADKVKAIYQYMQKKTRYVSVQLGIGGWQSFPAAYVEEKSYGDCKALTTYTKSLLNYYEIPSYPVLIRAGEENTDFSFPIGNFAYNPFNHVILAVPNQQDTIWLECTSQVQPFNYLGDFTMNRKGLMIKRNGQSHLVQTPQSSTQNDYSIKTIDVYLKEKGRADLEVNFKAEGLAAESIYMAHQFLSKEDFKEKISVLLEISNSTIHDYSYSVDNNLMKVEIKANFASTNISNQTGSRTFLPLLQFQSMVELLNDVENRKQEIIIPFSQKQEVEVRYHLPKGYLIENADLNASNLKSEIGQYEATFSKKDYGIEVRSTLHWQHGSFPPNTAENIANYLSQINETGKRMAVLKQE